MKPHDYDLVSCIIPVHNGEPYLRESVQSVLAQTYRPIEILVIDDGSTDGTAAALADYGEVVKYLWQPNAGPATARNRGVSEARGQFIEFLDADDLWHAEKLERQRRFLDERPELGYCVTHCQNFWVPELAEEAEKFCDHRISKPMPGYVTQTLFARRSVFDTVGVFNVTLGHGDDTDWFCRAAEGGVPGELLPDVLMFRRLHPANRSRVLASNSRQEYLRIIKARLDRRRRAGGTGE
jgi:glycosyltransferase involved in cell wall biosynthesis